MFHNYGWTESLYNTSFHDSLYLDTFKKLLLEYDNEVLCVYREIDG